MITVKIDASIPLDKAVRAASEMGFNMRQEVTFEYDGSAMVLFPTHGFYLDEIEKFREIYARDQATKKKTPEPVTPKPLSIGEGTVFTVGPWFYRAMPHGDIVAIGKDRRKGDRRINHAG